MSRRGYERPLLLVTLGGGGYENEALMLLRKLGTCADFAYVTSADTTWKEPDVPNKGRVYSLPVIATLARPSRFVTAYKLTQAVIQALPMVWRERPVAILGVASPICLPLFIWGKLFGVRCIFIESITRVDSLSTTGKIVARFGLSHRLFVQWPELESAHPKATYAGTIL